MNTEPSDSAPLHDAKINFSANGLGVTLHTSHGVLSFSSEEFDFYEHLFRIADGCDGGELTVDSLYFYSLLIRTNLSWQTIGKALEIVAPNKSSVIMNNATVLSADNTAEKYDNNVALESNNKKKKNKKRAQNIPSTNNIENSKPTGPVGVSVLSFSQWLILCKLIGYCQVTKKEPTEKVLRGLHGNRNGQLVPISTKVPVANFLLHEPRRKFAASSLVSSTDFPYSHGSVVSQGVRLRASLEEWYFCTDENRSQHVKFRLKVMVLNSVNDNKLDDEIFQTFEVERRFSEFEALSHILLAHCHGAIVPPLPLKSWNLPQIAPPSHALAEERSHELQLFLTDVCSHPVLRHAYMMQIFLLSSPTGMKSAVDLFTHLLDNEGKLLQRRHSSADIASNGVLGAMSIQGMTQLFTNGAEVVSNGANMLVSQARSSGYFAALWDAVSPALPVSTPPPIPAPISLQQNHTGENGKSRTITDYSTIANREDCDTYASESMLAAINRTERWLESVAQLGRRIETMLSSERAILTDHEEIALSYKLMAEFENVPALNRVLRCAGKAIKDKVIYAVDKLQEEHFLLQLPVQYLGRYVEGHRHANQQRITKVQEFEQAERHATSARKSLELTKISNSNGQTSNSQPDSQMEEQANLDVKAAESVAVEVLVEANRLTKLLARDGQRLERLVKNRLLSCMQKFANNRLESARKESEMWKNLIDEISS